MSQEGVERFFGRLLTDDAFRQRAASSLADACREEGYLLSEEELRLIREEDIERLGRAAAQLNCGIKRFSPTSTGNAAN